MKAFHKGATCIVPATVASEHGVEHGWNGLIADPNDVADVARQLDRLSLDRPYRFFLQRNALRTALLWPDWRQSANSMALAIEAIARSSPPE
ncbi:MAG: hypothetical protein HZB14_08395 [Actinobacteria bacterium]|nr:hypothetical protein [Actinomycetota bacterium]